MSQPNKTKIPATRPIPLISLPFAKGLVDLLGYVIDISELTEAQKATEDFANTYAGMMNLYKQSGFIAALCAHEAAHLTFYERIGRVPFEIVRPKIHYNDSLSRFEGLMAGVKPQLPDCEPGKWQEWVLATALGFAAGGVVGRRLFPNADGGDSEDKRLFIQLCADLVKRFGGISINAEEAWAWAQHEVSRQLDSNPKLMELIQKRAEELKALFGFTRLEE